MPLCKRRPPAFTLLNNETEGTVTIGFHVSLSLSLSEHIFTGNDFPKREDFFFSSYYD